MTAEGLVQQTVPATTIRFLPVSKSVNNARKDRAGEGVEVETGMRSSRSPDDRRGLQSSGSTRPHFKNLPELACFESSIPILSGLTIRPKFGRFHRTFATLLLH
jgi:hypothetical protein